MSSRNVFISMLASMLWAGMVSSAPLNATNSTTQGNTTSSSTTLNGSAAALTLQQGRSSTGLIVVLLDLRAKSKAAIDLLEKKYTFISQPGLKPIYPYLLGLISKSEIANCAKLTVVEKFQLLFRQFSVFFDPLNLVCNYEDAPVGSSNYAIAKSLKLTRVKLFDTVRMLRRSLVNRQATIPTFTKASENSLNSKTKNFLIHLQKFKRGVPPTDKNVKIYRNYVIINTIYLAATSISFGYCIPA